jgi:transposase
VKKFTRPVLRGGDDGNIIPLTRPWKKGQTYGTILVDLEKHQVIELLPDRRPETVERWLRTHPEIEIVSRDRGGDYAAAARKGAPQAQQVADRFHVVKNLREALRDLMERKQSCLPEAPEDERADGVPSKAQGRAKGIKVLEVEAEPGQEKHYRIMSPYLRQSARQTTYEALRTQVRRDNRSARYQAIRLLHQQGFSLREIARRLKISRQTVRRFVRAESFPERNKAPRKASLLDPYKPYLLSRWQQGCWNGAQLFEEIKTRGYSGSAPLLRRFLRELRTKQQEAGETSALPLDAAGRTIELPLSLSSKPPFKNRMAPSRAAWLFVSQPAKLDEKQRQHIKDIRAGHPDLETAYELSQRFVLILTERRGSELDGWLMQAKQSGIVELQRFATGIRRDYAAVRAAFSSPWNNGQVEAQVNCLKLQKRLMFGRAAFDLLRLRVLHAS